MVSTPAAQDVEAARAKALCEESNNKNEKKKNCNGDALHEFNAFSN